MRNYFRALALLMGMTTLVVADEPKPREPGLQRNWAAANAGRVGAIIAHRGASADRPENTLASTLGAIEAGATAVEVDVRTSRDGQLVLLHDATLDRTTTGKGPVREKTLAEIQQLDAGEWFDPKFAGQRVPTLGEALSVCRGKIDVLLDLKESGDDYARAVADDVKAKGEPQRTIVGVRSLEQARLFRTLLPQARQLGLLAKPEEIEAYANAGVETIRLWPNWLTADPSLSGRVRRTGARLHLNGTTGSRDEIMPLLEHEPDSLSSDDPARLAKTLAEADSQPGTGALRHGPVITTQGVRFRLDGQPFEMWGIRVASGTKDDAQCQHLIAQLDDYKAHGVNAITVFYMGCRGANYDPFLSDGCVIDPGHQRRMERIIRACAAREMVVVVGVFYQHAPFGLRDAEAVRNAVGLVTERLKPFGNVIINIANESNSYGWRDSADIFDFRDPRRIIELCRHVHEVDPRRLVGGGGYHPETNVVIGRSPEVDALLFDTAGSEPNSHELLERYLREGVTDKPMVNVELFGGWTNGFPRGVFPDQLKRAYFDEVDGAATQHGLSVFFHNSPWCQHPREPMRYDLGGSGAEDDPGIRWYFEYLRQRRRP